MTAYQQSVKALNDDYAIKSMVNTLKTDLAKSEAKVAELTKEKLNIAKDLKNPGLPTDQIMKITGLDQATFENLE